jgi:hypothetical protein
MVYKLPKGVGEQYTTVIETYMPGMGGSVVKNILSQFDVTKSQVEANARIVSTLIPFIGPIDASELENKLNSIKVPNTSKSL